MDIDLIKYEKLKRIHLEAGEVMHVLKNSEKDFVGFGETYFSKINQGAIKAWKMHNKMTLNLVVPIGEVEFVFYDQRRRNKTIVIGENNYQRINVPPKIWFGFRGISAPFSLIVNVADICHDDNEVQRENIGFIRHNWSQIK